LAGAPTGWPGLLLCAAGALPSVYTRCLQFMRSALVFGNVQPPYVPVPFLNPPPVHWW
jgi:hypothetical protein